MLWLLLPFSATPPPAMQASAPPTAAITFSFERAVPGVLVPRYTFAVAADGTTQYHAEIASPQSASLQPVDRELILSPATLKRATEALHQLTTSSAPCASKLKNIADTGLKTIVYRQPEGNGECTFNYSENKGAAQLADLFQGIEHTLEAGRALDFKHRFDRLGLDAEMANLASDADDGHALALETVVPTLRKIAADTELIERVRLRAAKLLDRAHAAP